jgi:hypothetical protein
MDLIKPTCRESLSDSDRAFLLETLGGTGAGRSAVQDLLQDPASLDLLLDEEALFQALLDLPRALRVSLQFYLYVLLRHILLRSGLDDREITDYLAAMLCCFKRAARLTDYRSGSEKVVECMADLEASAQSFGESGAFYIRVYMANFSLFLTGMFPQRIRYRRDRWGAPGLPYYTGVGRSNFEIAGRHRLARREGLSRTYQFLSSDYLALQAALHQLCDEFLFMHRSEWASAGLS